MNINMITTSNPTREVCDHFKLFPPWGWRMENVFSSGNEFTSFDLIKTTASVNKIIHVRNIDGIGLAIADIEECLNQKF